MARVSLKDDPRTTAYKRFGATDVANATEAKLPLAGVMMVKQGRKYTADYAGVGLTKELLDAVETNNANFVNELTTGKETGNGPVVRHRYLHRGRQRPVCGADRDLRGRQRLVALRGPDLRRLRSVLPRLPPHSRGFLLLAGAVPLA